jgi:hypothetical protein
MVPAKYPKALGYVQNTLKEKITFCGRRKKSEFAMHNCYIISFYYLCEYVIRVLHKGSIPTGQPGGQLISPKTTHSNIATWSEMSNYTDLLSKMLLDINWFC